MITENNLKTLDNLIAKYALNDYKRANPKLKYRKGIPVHNPYSLSPETNEAREMYHLALNPNITIEDENKVKAYLLKKKLLEDN